ncbi:Inner membrane protein yhiM, partial [human gut metagenome]
MGLICIALGGFVLESSGQSEYFVAGHVLISLAAICLALFTTAFIIISQLTRG